MSDDRLARLSALFDAVVDLPPAERHALLDDACAGDPASRAEIERLLAADAAIRGEEFIESAIRAAAGELELDNDRSGSRAGPYLLRRLLGRGGMGAVYVADRADDEYRAQVAVKLVPNARFSDDTVRRFLAERQILASLEHPNVARLLDGGTLDDGTPYLVMELVDGVPLDRYCDDVHADIDRRLDLFLAVCDAVAHAHRRLVVHRDIKPGNILVGENGVPKLLDFGIAKLLDRDGMEGDLVATGASTRLMTPAYASPEQVRGEAITTATDVYALGLLLYELLTGRPAHRFERAGSSFEEMGRVITADPPVRPSDAITPECEADVARNRSVRPEQLRRALRGDLDTIVMMALRKEPERRYRSVDQLIADVRAYRAGRPVSARADSFMYRASRFVSRHRAGVAVGAAAVVTLTAVGATMAVQAHRVARERATSLAVSSFLIGLFRAADPWVTPRADVTVRELLARGAARVDRELQSQSAVQATLFDDLAHVYDRLALPDSALRLAERAVSIRRAQGASDSLLAASMALRAALLDELGRETDAIAADSAALVLRRSLFGEEHADVAASLQQLGGEVFSTGKFDEGIAMLRQALAIFRRVLGSDSARTLRAQVVLAGALHFAGKGRAAESLLVDALPRQRRALGPDHPEIVQTLNTLGVVRDNLDERDSAAADLRAAIAMAARHVGPDHEDLLNPLGNLAGLYGRIGPLSTADSIYRDLIARRRGAHLDFAVQANNYAVVLLDLHRAAEAETLLVDGIRDLERRVPERGGTYAYLFNRLGQIRAARGNLAGSDSAYREAVAIARRVYGDSSPITTQIAAHLADVQARRRGTAATQAGTPRPPDA